MSSVDAIFLEKVKTHNLKNFDLIMPHKKLYVFTGVSGSGKSSLAFDTLYAEGQRRYVESLSAYARQFLERMEKPDVESVSGIPPALALEAKNGINNARSTVGTQTEINDYLRVFFSRVGRTLCPDCNVEVVHNHPENAANHLLEAYPEKEVLILFNVSLGKKGARYLQEFLAELQRQGFTEYFLSGKILSGDELLKHKNVPEKISICGDRIKISAFQKKRLVDSLEQAYRFGKGEIQVVVRSGTQESKASKALTFSEGLRCYSCGRTFRDPVPNLFSFNSPLGACLACQGFGRIITIDWDLVVPDKNKSIAGGAIDPWTKPSASWEFKHLLKFCKQKKIPTDKPWKDLSPSQQKWILEGDEKKQYFSVLDFFDYLQKKTYKMHVRIFLSKYRGFSPCPQCKETRLKAEALCVQVATKNIVELQALNIEKLYTFFEKLSLSGPDKEKVEPVYQEILKRVKFLKEVGLGYLTLSRLSRTLSGGEVQRINLATSLGSALVDTLYVLDEPSIGLHERDNHLLIRLLKELRDLGNTVVVVEHDRTMIEEADEVIDLGPLGGEKGGRIVFQGSVEDLKKSKESITGNYLSGEKEVKRRRRNGTASKKFLRILGASEHNLKNINVDIPFKQLTVITGISGSGKSTLLYDVLYSHYLRYRGRPVQDLGAVKSIKGFEEIDEMVLIDQSPMGRSPRSNPATYTKAFDDIRNLFARTSEARRQGLTPGNFSFNVDGGRCPACKGDGRVKVEMHFLADVHIPCEECQGKRFKKETLDIRYEGKNLDEVLAMTIDEASNFFASEKTLVEKLSLLKKVGLGYLTLGQSALTLSGGEAQRLKLACEMSERTAQHLLYLFDEPTTGLHFYDIHYLMEVFEELLVRGHSIVVIEHHMDIIRSADFIIDLGPEGGERGGKVVYSGSVEGLSTCANSFTGRYLKQYYDKVLRQSVVLS